MWEILQKYSALLIYPLVALSVSVILTFLCIRVLPKFGYIDKPGGRHIHKRLIPRGGGIAVIIAFFVGLGLYVLHAQSALPIQQTIEVRDLGLYILCSGRAAGCGDLFWRLFWPAIILGTLGLVDDRRELKSWFKLGIQLIVAFIIWYTGDREFSLFGWHWPWYFSLVLSMGWVIIIINAFNLIDGLDGLASGLSVVSACCMAIWFLLISDHEPQAVTMLVLAGACLGFLRYNFHPAQIFLGDTGSTFLGLIFAIIGLSAIDRAVTLSSLLLPLLAIGVPLFDVFLAIWRRSMRKLLDPEAGGIMEGDQDHLHHRLLRKTKSQTATAYFMYLIACGFSLVALAMILLKDSAPAVAFIVLCIGVLIAIRQLAMIELFDSARLVQIGVLRPRRGLLLNFVHPFIDFAALSISYIIASFLLRGTIRGFSDFLYAFVPVALLLCLSGLYKVYWLRAALSSYWRLGLILFIGLLLSCGALYFFCYPDWRDAAQGGLPLYRFIGGCLIYTLLSLCLIGLERFFVHYMEGFWFRKLWMMNVASECPCRVLIYGGGLKCRLYVDYLNCAKKNIDVSEVLVGIADEDKALHGLEVYGLKVLGGSDELEFIYQRHPFDKIIATTRQIEPDSKERILNFCKEKNLIFCQFQVGEDCISPGEQESLVNSSMGMDSVTSAKN